MLSVMLLIALAILSLAIVASLYRLLKGPSIPDRLASLDLIGVLLLSMIAIICMLFKTYVYFDIILVIGILTFIGTTAFTRYIEKGVVIDDGDDQNNG